MIGKKSLLNWSALLLVAVLCCGVTFGQTQEGRKLLKKVDPAYPELAQRMNLRGTVRVEIWIATNGSVQSVTVLGGHPVLAGAVTEAVKQWKYSSSSEGTKKELEFKF
ncbi:MAG: energy transducer TonB [Candidatus Acidiferrales bacterium]